MVVDHECGCGCGRAFSYRAINYEKIAPPRMGIAGYGRRGITRIAQPVLSCCKCGKKTWIGKTIFHVHQPVKLKEKPGGVLMSGIRELLNFGRLFKGPAWLRRGV